MTNLHSARKRALRFISLNQKGGVGKTMLTWLLGRALAGLGLVVLVVDLDPQGNLTFAMKLLPPEDEEISEDSPTLRNALMGTFRGEPADLLKPYPHHDNLFLLPWSWDHFTLSKDLDRSKLREQRLSDLLGQFDGLVDVILVDCPPTLDILTDNAVFAVGNKRGRVLIPVEPEDFSLRATRILLSQIEVMEREFGDDIDVAGFVISKMVDTLIAEDCKRTLLASGIPVLATVRQRTQIRECVREGKALQDYLPSQDQVTVYRRLAKDLMKAEAA
ncbi:ParA family protein [Streptomyces sp. NPDC006632]|uniref:ParA family protein n=1 Tax=Streptomyces sp. NPDC006632 TaxID=3157182 RepID=UPI0033A2EC2D